MQRSRARKHLLLPPTTGAAPHQRLLHFVHFKLHLQLPILADLYPLQPLDIHQAASLAQGNTQAADRVSSARLLYPFHSIESPRTLEGPLLPGLLCAASP